MLRKILKYTIIAAIGCYLLFALVIIPAQRNNDKCGNLIVSIEGNKLGTINNAEITEILKDGNLHPKGKDIEKVSCLEIEQFIKQMSLIKECQAYKTNNNDIKLKIVCREPVLKVCGIDGEFYHVDTEGNRIDDLKKPLLLPVVSGHINNGMLKRELKDVVTAIKRDPFWLAQIEQIHFNDKREAVIIPRIGDHTIEIGTTKELDEKLRSIKKFYIAGLSVAGWNKYSKLNVKISNKVICTIREK